MSSFGGGTGSQYSTPTHSQYGTPVSALKHEGHLSQNMPPNQLQPTWTGYVADTYDALVLFQGAIDGILRKVVRRPHDRERTEVIRSGAVFIYEESASGIKRWTDGVPWSPSRILGNFLIYRELEKPFPPGEKKRATKKVKSPRPGDPYPPRELSSMSSSMSSGASMPGTPTTMMPSPQSSASQSRNVDAMSADRDSERSLVGSLTDSYAFKEGGLVKKTLSINHDGGHLHLVSYYNPEDVKQDHLKMRTDDERINHIQVRPELIQQQNFRAPIDSADEVGTPGGMGAAPAPAAPAPPSNPYRTTLPQQYVSSAHQQQSPFMSGQSYPLPHQPIPHSSSSYYANMGTTGSSGSQLHGSYPYAGYTDFYKNLSSNTAQTVPHPHYQGMTGQTSHLHMHPDQSSYVQQSSYQLQDNRTHSTDSYGDTSHIKSEWPDSHR